MPAHHVAPLFVNRDANVRQTYDRLVQALERFGDIAIETDKNSVIFVAQSPFLGALPLQSQLRLSILAAAPIDNPRIRKCTRVAPNRFHNQVDLSNQWDLDDEVLGWIKAAFQLGG